jgi:hypothetical protein
MAKRTPETKRLEMWQYPYRLPLRISVMLSLLMLLLGTCLPVFAQQDLFAQHHAMMLDAMEHNQIERVKALLKTPYVLINDPNYDTSYLAYACVYDAASDKSEIVKVLLDAGADVKWHNAANSTLFNQLAMNARRDPTLGILIQALKMDTGGVDTPSFKAIINMQAQLGNTALYNLVDRTGPNDQDNALFVARLLIEDAQADPTIPGHLGMTPHDLAKAKHLDRMVQYLQAHPVAASAAITFRCDASAPDECAFSVIDGSGSGGTNFVLAAGETRGLTNNFSGGRYCVVVSKRPAQVEGWPRNCNNLTEPSRGGKVVDNIRPGQTYD